MADVVAKSKSALKKAKQKAEAAVTPALSSTEKTASEHGANGSEPAGKTNGVDDNAYVKEIQK